jgi:hypothetical protein
VGQLHTKFGHGSWIELTRRFNIPLLFIQSDV